MYAAPAAGPEMTRRRKPLPKAVEKGVLMASRRRCCLCVFLCGVDAIRKGQIAHLNHDPSDFRFENLVFLCLEHHDEYDGRTAESKGFTAGEVRAYRDRLYSENQSGGKWVVQRGAPLAEPAKAPRTEAQTEYEMVRTNHPEELTFTRDPWRFPLWQVANEPEFFAYKAGNRADGVCLIERVNIPDGRIVIACTEYAGNPGQSITNSVEELCFQVCERFEIPADRLVWLEHYDDEDWNKWRMVTFGTKPPHGVFGQPKWVDMTPEMWRGLRLKPRRKLRTAHTSFESNLVKLFSWPTEAL
jgi:hypothetical protein